MKRLYITVLALLIISIVIFLLSFVYIDKNKHRTYYYVINSYGRDVGTIRVDKFVTEDKLIYKTVTETPLGQTVTGSKSRLVFGRNYSLEGYTGERSANGAIELISIERRDGAVSFVSRLNARFAFLDAIPVRKEIFVFEEGSPATYMPIIENYDFRRGRSQGFNTISPLSDWELPPMKRFVTLTSIKDEYVKIGRRKIKTENLLLKIKNFPQGAVWVAKSDRSLVMIDIPQSGLRITRTFSPAEFKASDYLGEAAGYASREVTFKNDGSTLSGTLTYPEAALRYPAVLLVQGDGPEDRNDRGLFAAIAGHLSKSGFAVLRFDKRGIGSSGGAFSSLSESDEVGDIAAAFDFLSGQNEVDPARVFILGHGRGALYALNFGSRKKAVKGLILMAPEIYSRFGAQENFGDYDKVFSNSAWSPEYAGLVRRSVEAIRQRAERARRKWTFVMWKRCFVKRIREEMGEKPSAYIKDTKQPVLILQGMQDNQASLESAAIIDKILQDSYNPSHIMTYYGYVGRFFGKEVNSGMERTRYDIDKDVLAACANWLNQTLIEAEKPQEVPVAPIPDGEGKK